MDDEVLTPSEAAVFLKTGEQRLLRLARKGEIRSFTLGKRGVRFYRSTSAGFAAPMQERRPRHDSTPPRHAASASSRLRRRWLDDRIGCFRPVATGNEG